MTGDKCALPHSELPFSIGLSGPTRRLVHVLLPACGSCKGAICRRWTACSAGCSPLNEPSQCKKLESSCHILASGGEAAAGGALLTIQIQIQILGGSRSHSIVLVSKCYNDVWISRAAPSPILLGIGLQQLLADDMQKTKYAQIVTHPYCATDIDKKENGQGKCAQLNSPIIWNSLQQWLWLSSLSASR